MSVVDNYALLIGLNEEFQKDGEPVCPAVDALNELIAPNQMGRGFAAVDQHCGGYKAFEARCFLFAGNYLPLYEMAGYMLSVEWDDAEAVRLVHMGQDDDAFRMYDMRGLSEVLSEAKERGYA